MRPGALVAAPRAQLFGAFLTGDLFRLVLHCQADDDITKCLENDGCSPGDLEEVEPEMLMRRMEEGSFKIKGRCLFIILLLLKNQMPITEQLFDDVAADLTRSFQFQALCLAHVCAKGLDAKGRANEVLEQINTVGLLQETESLLESDHEQAEEIQRMAGMIYDMMEQASSPTYTNGFRQRTGRKWTDIKEISTMNRTPFLMRP
jgi:hypothetical protein